MRFAVIPTAMMLTALTACSTSSLQTKPATTETQSAWHQHKTQLTELTHWKINGRFGAKNDKDAWSGNIKWLQNNQKYEINLSGPLSSGSVALSGDEEFSTLQVAEDQFYGAENAEQLLETHTGIRLPMSNLKYWILGLPSPSDDKQVLELDAQGRLSKLSQLGWEISFRHYAVVNNYVLPDKIFLENHEFDVRLIIHNWQILS